MTETANNDPIFLHPNTSAILQELKKDSALSGVSLKQIRIFQNALSAESKHKEFRILRGKKRYLSQRKWLSFAPGTYTLPTQA